VLVTSLTYTGNFEIVPGLWYSSRRLAHNGAGTVPEGRESVGKAVLQELEAEAPPGQLFLAQVTAPLQQDLQHRPMQATGMNQA
jgi:hypothetical protein